MASASPTRTGRRRTRSGPRRRGRQRRLIVMLAVLVAAAIGGCLAMALRAGAAPPAGPPPARSDAGGPVRNEMTAWRPVAIGGGGFITGMAWDRGGRTRIVRTDVYGAYRWDAAADRWQQVITTASMPAADHVQDGIAEGVYEVAVAPGDARRAYLATRGRIYRSDDGGRHWQRTNDPADGGFRFDSAGPYRLGGPYLAVAPRDPDVVLFGTPAGLWRSDDAGGRWQSVPSVPAARAVRPDQPKVAPPGISVWFKGDDGHEIWAASPANGLFRSTDGGGSFTRLAAGGPRHVRRGAFAADGSFYAAEDEAARLWRFADGGWTDLVAAGRVPGRAWATIAADPRDGSVLASDQGGRLWCSSDRGGRWRPVSRRAAAGPGDPPWLRVADHPYFATAEIAFDPVEAGRLWTAAGTGVFTAKPAAGCTGIDWQSRTRGIEELVTNDVVSAPGMAPVFAAWDFGIHRKPDLDRFSTGYGPRERVLIAAQQIDWTPARPGFLVTNASDTRMGCCSEDGQSVLAGYSEDGGATWTRFATLPQPPGTRADDPWRMSFGTIAVAAGDPDTIVWMPAFNRSPYRTADRGRTWQRVSLPGERLPLTGSFGPYYLARKVLTADRVRPRTFYLLHSGGAAQPALQGLWTSTDGGANWARTFPGSVVPASAFSAKLRAVPGFAGHLFLTNGVRGDGDTRLRRSEDGGTTWTTLDRVTRVDDIGFGRPARGADYPTIFLSGQLSGAYGIWRSVDRARSWQRLADFPLGTLDQVTVVEGDKDVFGRVYLGYKGSGWLYGEPAACARPRDALERCVPVR